MDERTASPLLEWESFYVIVGSSAAVLIGLMFVAITLLAGTRERGSRQGVDAFSTPSVAHFCAALLVAVILSAPWQALSKAGLLLGLTGLSGLAYALIVMRRVRRLGDYRPELEDWLWYVALPLIAYTTLVAAAIMLPERSTTALFAIGAGTVLLLFTGIHNAWDMVTYLVVEGAQPKDESED